MVVVVRRQEDRLPALKIVGGCSCWGSTAQLGARLDPQYNSRNQTSEKHLSEKKILSLAPNPLLLTTKKHLTIMIIPLPSVQFSFEVGGLFG